MSTLKAVYEPRSEAGYRAECDTCDWWETTETFATIRVEARVHMTDENLRSGHESAIVTIWKSIGEIVNEIGPER
jgi:hypothetical protein